MTDWPSGNCHGSRGIGKKSFCYSWADEKKVTKIATKIIALKLYGIYCY
jgi:hypothetical protein